MNITLGEMESRFADVIRENEGISSGELVKICAEKFGWKKSTTYTMLRRLCDKGICENKDGHVSSLVSKEDIAAMKTDEIIRESFGGSAPFSCSLCGKEKAFRKRDRRNSEDDRQIQRGVTL